MSEQTRIQNATRFAEALRRFDEENGHDPHQEIVNGLPRPRELVYAEWLTDWVLRLCPNASEPLRLAARCQHLCRWMVPRDSYPMTRAGYLKWREDLKHFHAREAGEILAAVGYPTEVVAQVQTLNLKKNFPADPEARVLEDALCLVFLERQFAALAGKTSEEKIVNAVQKAWQKMSPAARDEARRLAFGPREQVLLKKALGA